MPADERRLVPVGLSFGSPGSTRFFSVCVPAASCPINNTLACSRDLCPADAHSLPVSSTGRERIVSLTGVVCHISWSLHPDEI